MSAPLPFYFFNDAYFASMATWPSSLGVMALVRKDEQVVAAAVILISGSDLHYHLAAASSEPGARRARAASFLLHEIFEWGAGQGAQRIHLGGGRTTAADDSLFEFKAGFSPTRADFMVGKAIHDRIAYDRLIDDWRARSGHVGPPPRLLAYRLNPQRETFPS